MTQSSKTDASTAQAVDMIKTLQNASLTSAPDFGRHWIEAMSQMGGQMLSFTAERIRKDVETQHAMLKAKTLGEVQHIQAQFFQRAMEDYIAETCKLMDMSRSFAPNATSDPKD